MLPLTAAAAKQNASAANGMTSVLPLINRCIGSPTRCRRLKYK